ncbi:MAG: ABC transporter ATP-binding protein [bacterium]|nr:ABC transporter ATP-binding protein [bacterium]
MTRQVLVENEPLVPAAALIAGSAIPVSRAAQPPALRVADLTKTFRSGFARRRLRGVEGVSFSVGRGEVFALLGHNGAGKTTTIGCLLDLVRPDRGEITLLGCDHRDRRARARIGYLPERPYFFDYLTGRELLEFYCDLLDVPRRERRDRVDGALRRVGMMPDAGRRLGKYSKGMLQRLGLAQALLGEPELLILDEPMSGLDPMGRREVRTLLQELKNQGCTIVLSSHIVPDVEQLADAVGILREGRLVLNERLGALADACAYRVRAAGCLGEAARCGLPPWALSGGGDTAAAQGPADLAAADTQQLRELLDACHAAGLPVLAVEPRRTGLEDLFLRTHEHGTVVHGGKA